jgi:hypothetical protein
MEYLVSGGHAASLWAEFENADKQARAIVRLRPDLYCDTPATVLERHSDGHIEPVCEWSRYA